jgi:hypothetical protein
MHYAAYPAFSNFGDCRPPHCSLQTSSGAAPSVQFPGEIKRNTDPNLCLPPTFSAFRGTFSPHSHSAHFPIAGILYSVFRIQSAHLPYRWHIVLGFSHTFASSTLSWAHCIRFYAYIRLIYLIIGTLYSVFRIHSISLSRSLKSIIKTYESTDCIQGRRLRYASKN